MFEDVIETLRDSRCRPNTLAVPVGAGVYAYYLREAASLAPFAAGPEGLIYVGLATNLERRELENHLNTGATGRSTLRRSLGAILKNELSLTAVPRSASGSRSKMSHFKFHLEGECRLTQWMLDCLEIGACSVADPKAVETLLISTLRPILNLSGWPNPSRREIRRLRSICAAEASGLTLRSVQDLRRVPRVAGE